VYTQDGGIQTKSKLKYTTDTRETLFFYISKSYLITMETKTKKTSQEDPTESFSLTSYYYTHVYRTSCLGKVDLSISEISFLNVCQLSVSSVL